MKTQTLSTRRDFMRTAATFTALASAPWIVPASVLGKEGAAAPSERITLGVIGFGPRCAYVLRGMLAHPDMQCVAVADVQASRRDEGKMLVDQHYGNADCAVYRDFRELLARDDLDAVLIAAGDRWHAPASILAAKAGKDVYSEKPCGLTIGYCQELAEHDQGDRPRLPSRHPASQRGEFQGSRQACADRQAGQTSHHARVRLHPGAG